MSREKPIRSVTPFDLPLEGRLLAHRRLLVELLRSLPLPRQAALMDWLDDRAIYQDGQEGIELELARADEFQLLKRLCSRLDPE
jgi:hypothetical protein